MAMDDDSLVAIVAFCSVALPWVLACCAVCWHCAACCYCRPNAPACVAAAAQAAGPSRRDGAPTAEPVVAEKPPQLGYFLYSAAGVAEEEGRVRGAAEKVCTICLDELVDGMECSKVPACGHVYCRECITLWMRNRSTCPMCRELIVPRAEPLSAAEEMV